jgi:hypothetical protein
MTTQRREQHPARPMRAPRLALSLLMAALSWQPSTSAHAAFPVRILVIAGKSVPAGMRAHVIAGLRPFGEIVPERVYAAAAKRAGLPPDSAAALDSVAPNLGVRMIVVLGIRRGVLLLSFRDGSTVAPLQELALPLRRQQLPADARQQLMAASERALAITAQPTTAAPAPPAPELESSAAIAYDPEPLPPPAAMPAQPEAAEPEASASVDADAPPAPVAAPAFRVNLAVGIGVGQRSVHVPTGVGEQRLDSGFFPALDLALSGDAQLGEHALFGASAHYQTSLGLHALALPPASVDQSTSLRSHRVELGLTPGYRFSSATSSVSIRLFAGWWLRGLRSVVDTRVPSNTLHGPVLRPELRIPIAGDGVVLRFAPELSIIVGATAALRDLASAQRVGLAFGAEVALELRVASSVRLLVAYRESRATLATAWSSSFSDHERFATVSAVLSYW